MAKHNEVGSWGEKVATEYFVAKGYDILERNWRLNRLELDIIARTGQRVVFVEVKTRSSAENVADLQTLVGNRKLQNMVRAANAYMKLFNINFTAQFDIVIISGTKENFKLEHFPDAYFPPMKTYR